MTTIITILIVLVILSLVDVFINHGVYGKFINEIPDLSKWEGNILNNTIISEPGSPLFIANHYSILSKYYICEVKYVRGEVLFDAPKTNNEGQILRWSKAHKEIKAKFKQLKQK